METLVIAWRAYDFTPLGDIAGAAYVPRGIHRVSNVEVSDTGAEFFQVVGSKRWHAVDMFNIKEIKGEW